MLYKFLLYNEDDVIINKLWKRVGLPPWIIRLCQWKLLWSIHPSSLRAEVQETRAASSALQPHTGVQTRRCLMNFLFASTMANFSLFTATKQAKNHSRYNLPLAAIMDSSRVIYSQTISYILSPLFAWAAAGKWQTF